MIKLVAFDWNGTLLADNHAVFEADNAVLKFLGKKPVSFHDFLEHFDVPVKNYYLALGVSEKTLGEKSRAMSETFHSYYEPRAEKVRTRSHAKIVLKWLKLQKIPSVIISNHIKEKIQRHLLRLKIEDYFEEILGNHAIYSAMQERNKKERLSDYLKAKRLNPKQVLIVGDTIEEVEIARDLGTQSAAITHGNVSTPRLKAAKPDYLISDLGNLINIIREINLDSPNS